MKKLLSFMAIVTLITSTSTLTVSCGKEEITNQISSKSINILLKEMAKNAYLNNVKDYDFNYVFNSVIKNQQIQRLNGNANFDTNDEFTSSSKFSDIANKYFESNVYSSDETNVEGINLKKGQKPEESSALQPFIKNLPSIIDSLGDKNTAGVGISILEKSGLLNLKSFANSPLLKIITKAIPADAFSNLSTSFFRSEYNEMSVQTALSSSIISMINAINKFSYPDQNSRPNHLDASTSESVKNNYPIAMQQLSNTIKEILNGNAKFTFDMFNNTQSIADILNFVRVLSVYISGFFETYKDASYKEVSTNDLKNYRSKSFDDVTKNTLNLKSAINYFLDMFYINDGMAAKNLMKLLFYEDFSSIEQGGSNDYKDYAYLDIEIGLSDASEDGVIKKAEEQVNKFKDFLMKDYNGEYNNTGGISTLVRTILNSVITENKSVKIGNVLTKGLGLLSTDRNRKLVTIKILGDDLESPSTVWGKLIKSILGTLKMDTPENILKKYSDKIADSVNDLIPLTQNGKRAVVNILSTNGIVDNTWGTIWNKPILYYLSKIIDFKIELNEPGQYAKSIADIVENFDLIKKINLYDFMGLSFDKNRLNSLKNLSEYFLSHKNGYVESSGQTEDNGGGVKNIPTKLLKDDTKINFNTLSSLVKNAGSVLPEIAKNPDDILEKLGIINNNIEENSFADNFIDMLNDIKGIKNITPVIETFMDRFDFSQKVKAKQILDEYNKIGDNDVDEKIINLYQYQYRVRDKIITFDLKKNAELFFIKKIKIINN
ncbi:MOLPALP family lipoprotein [Spiroplasma gladiatoris]|uniref:MOLPALP family lipoprotein n=1 Tax=Spiroplasma gladiatoris TaxID=2143 RepID=A0A4P7AGU0_9MOLU|nr:hypothetical protein [Spiroplasma gladiatoris]QBQ07634.1 MOLPALP family lipoprotein [Spiroplasma gladiatoris]